MLNQYFPPDSVSTAGHVKAIAERLVGEGHRVSAVVGQPSYSAGQPAEPERELVDGIDVRRIGLGRSRGRERMRSRVQGYLRYVAGAWRASRGMRPDVVICFHNPPFLPLLGARIARGHGVPMVYVVQDIHPDILLATGWMKLPRPVIRAWEMANRRMLASARSTVVLGEGMRRTLIGKGADPGSVEVIPLWAEPPLAPRPLDREWRSLHGVPADHLVVLCAGNMGIMHPLEPLLDAAESLRARPVSFVLAGGGTRRPHWERQVGARRLENVRFLPFQRGEDFARMVAGADLGLVPLADGLEGLALPARTFALMAAARPVIAVMASEAEVATMLEETGSGWRAGSAADLERLLESLLTDRDRIAAAGARAQEVAATRFSEGAITARYAELVRGALTPA